MDIRQQLLAAFEVEHREHIDAIRAALAHVSLAHVSLTHVSLAGAVGNVPPDWNDVFRRAHSLKGASRAVDLPKVEAVAHRLETLFERIVAGDAALDREATGAVHLALDRIEAYVAALKGEADPAMPADALASLDRCLAGPSPVPAEPPPARPDSPAVGIPAPSPPQKPPPIPAEPTVDAGALLRVPADAVEAMTRASHELTSALGAESVVAEGLAKLQRDAAALGRRAETLRGGEARSGKGRSEPGADASGLDAIRAELRGFETALLALARDAALLGRIRTGAIAAADAAAARIGREAERLALVPAETVFGAFPRALRDMAREAGREIDVVTRGLDLPVDRAMLQSLKDPVLHALRNALSHGAEPPEQRERRGKPPELSITLDVAVRGGRLVIGIHDDGRGPDLRAIEATARARGLIGGVDGDPDSFLALVFEPGFSTASAIDTLSGRGIGLSVVADTVRRLGGSVRLEPRVPAGTSLIMHLPLSAARRTLLLVDVGAAIFALPSASVERLLRLDRSSLSSVMGRTMVRLPREGGEDLSLPLVDLAGLIGVASEDNRPSEGRPVTAVLMRAGGRSWAMRIDALRDVRNLLVLPAPPIGADPRLISGTVVLGGDTPVLVLDPDGLAARAGETSHAAPEPIDEPSGTAALPRRSTILVVDDSITTRTLEKGILESAGYRVVVCVDGQDALDRLRAGIERVDLVVADVEMPRLDGFGLLKALRADEAFARLPLILMTSRGDADDVARGLSLGADAYLTKQTFDQRQLLDTIGQLL
ncbi:response regulator [Methylobacterium bullatum]|uniref:Chemotaxis protein CheA n=1 Tax=Methylobacterium bullatum TaxID=570505 RepID=A0AAV4Z213_9HYPH|nr:response regulator [Methylobacterium bullatum]MBD8904202.1 hybrid sensor histidine kinase/response regulator [Methylobacterium bullatum]GJD37983.1 Sensor histidine kinase RcsC [Methylobacterium bullatum]